MIVKENIVNQVFDKIPKLHNLVVDLGFNLHRKNYVKYYSHEDIRTINVDNKKSITIDLINHFSSRNRKFKKNKLLSWKNNYNNFLLENKKNNVAMYQHRKSKIILLDIDTHEKLVSKKNLKLTSLNIIEEFRTIFNCPNFSPTLIQISKRKRGIHFYIPIDLQYDSIEVEYFLKYFKKYFEENNKDYTLEWRSETKAVRLPYTVDYSTYRYENEKLIRTTFTHLDKIKPIELNIKKVNLVLENIYGKEKFVIFERNSFFTNSHSIDFSMYRGNRIKQHLALARYCHRRNLSYEEYLELCNFYNKGSKDLNLHFHKTCKKVWESTKNYSSKISTISTSFISNLDKLSKKDIRNIKQVIFKNSNYFKHSSRLVQKNEIEIFCKELFGYINYQETNPRKIRKKVRITKEKRNHMLVGYQFPINLQEEIIQAYSLKSNRRKLFKIFTTFFMDQYKHNSRGWSEGCCRQYRKKEKINISKYYMEYFLPYQKKDFHISYLNVIINREKNGVINNTC